MRLSRNNCIFDTELETLEIKRARYDIKAAQTKIRTVGLPERLAQRLDVGQ